MAESALCHIRASVMMYDSEQKRWFPCAGSGISRVNIYQHGKNQTFRVVGRKLDTQEISVNCAILKGLIYNEATATFHQWRHNGIVYGLNFLSQEEASVFSSWMNKALDFVCGRIAWPCELPEYGSSGRQVLSNDYPLKIESSRAPPQNLYPRSTESDQSDRVLYQNQSDRVSYHNQSEPLSNHYQSEPRQPVSKFQPKIHLPLESQISNLSITQKVQPATCSLNNTLLAEIRGGASLRPVNGVRTNAVVPSVIPAGNFNDELKRRLAGRQMNPLSYALPAKSESGGSGAMQSPLPTRADSSDYSSEPSPNTTDKPAVVSAPTEAIRRVIRAELQSFRGELIDQFREVVRAEIRNLQYDSNH